MRFPAQTMDSIVPTPPLLQMVRDAPDAGGSTAHRIGELRARTGGDASGRVPEKAVEFYRHE